MSSLQLQKLRISIKAYESELLNSSCNKIIEAVKASDTKVIGPIPLPTKVRRYCVLTSPHVNKDAREHFEIRTHKRIIDVYKPMDSTLENLRRLDIRKIRNLGWKSKISLEKGLKNYCEYFNREILKKN